MPKQAIAPDGGWGWMVLVSAFISYAIVDGWSYSFGVVYPDLLTQFEVGKGQTALIAALLYGVPLLVSPVVCAITNVYGCRMAALAGGAITTCYFVANSFATSVPQLCILTGSLAGVGLAMVYVPTLVAVTAYFEKRRGIATALAVTGSGIGAFVFPIVVDRLMQMFGWRGMMLLFAAIALHLLPAAGLYRPLPVVETCPPVTQTESDSLCTPDDSSSPVEDTRASPRHYIGRLQKETAALYSSMFDRSLARHPPYILFCCSTFILYLCFSVPYVYLVDLVLESNTSSLGDAVILLSIVGGARTVGQLVLGYLGDRLRTHIILLYSVTVAAAGLGTAAVPLIVGTYPLLVCYAVVFGVGASATYVLQMLCLVQLVGLQRSTSAFGIFQLVQGIATTAGTPLAGLLFDMTQRYDYSFYTAGALILISGIMLLPITIWPLKQ